MPLLDVTELLSDPDLVCDFQVIRSVRSVSTGGLTVDTPGTYYATGSIQPSTPQQLNQLPEAERVGAFVTVYTQFALTALTDTTAPDQVVYQGRNYRVKQVNDWTMWGAGWVQAICELTTLTAAGPL